MLVRLKEDFAARELCLECRLLVFRHCAKRTQTRLCMSRVCECSTGHKNLTVETTVDHAELLEVGKGAPFRRDPTSKLVGVVIELTKIELLERDWKLLGQCSCNKSGNVSKHTTHVCWDIQLAFQLVVAYVEKFQIYEFAELLGQFSCKRVEMSANTQRMYVGTYNLPRN